MLSKVTVKCSASMWPTQHHKETCTLQTQVTFPTPGSGHNWPTKHQRQVLCVDNILELSYEDLPGQLEDGLVLQDGHPRADAAGQPVVLPATIIKDLK